jgi:hypothetical protein
VQRLELFGRNAHLPLELVTEGERDDLRQQRRRARGRARRDAVDQLAIPIGDSLGLAGPTHQRIGDAQLPSGFQALQRKPTETEHAFPHRRPR